MGGQKGARLKGGYASDEVLPEGGGLRAGQAIMVACPCNTSFFKGTALCTRLPPHRYAAMALRALRASAVRRRTASIWVASWERGKPIAMLTKAMSEHSRCGEGALGALKGEGGREGGREGGVKLRPGPGRVPPEDKEGGFYKRKSKRRAPFPWLEGTRLLSCEQA